MTAVHTSSGDVRGVELDGVRRFGGIPFAAPPVGDRRWAPPQPPESWTGERDATGFGNVAVQTIDTGLVQLRGTPSEDCLYLNVWTAAEAHAGLPVMVWIHGGGFLNGSGSATVYDGAGLARRGVVVVSFNYRLGAFGFLADPRLGTNFGLLDQVAALQWVQQNVAAFGGDPGNVTIFGQSAGAASVRSLLSTPAASGLFARAIIESAGFEDYAVVESPSYERSLRASRQIFDQLGTSDPAELRRVPTEQVRAASFAASGLQAPAGQVHTPANLTWYPVADGRTLFPDDFAAWPTDAPLLVGLTAQEGRFFVRPNLIYGHPDQDPAEMYTPETLSHMAGALVGAEADRVLQHYAGLGQDAYESIADLVTDAVWFEPAQESMLRFARTGRPVYTVEFERVSPGARRSGLLAAHMAEVPYIFGPLTERAGYDEVDDAVQQIVQAGWISFATDGVPRLPDGTAWPRFDAESRRITVIGDSARTARFALGPVAQVIAEARAETVAITH